jgi:translation initiation factor IF-2
MSDKVITKRLSKVARELNVGISTIVDFLSSKDIAIESNPNTKIDNATYEILSNEFQSEKSAKEESEKVTLPSNERAKISLDSKEEPAENAEDTDSEEEDDDQGVLIKNVSPAAADKAAMDEKEQSTQAEKSATKEDIPTEVEEKKATKGVEITPVEDATPEEEGSGPKVLGKINLEALNLKTRPDKRSKKEKEKEAAAEAKKKADEAAAKKAQQEADKKEATDKAAAEKAKAEKLAAEKAEDAARKEAEAAAKETPKEREEIKTNYEKLDGPKVLGKIELPSKAAKKPVASSSDKKETEKPKRKRRKRLSNVPQETAQEREARRGKGPRGAKGRKSEPKPELTEKEIQDQVKETLARLQGNNSKSKGAKYRRQKRDAASEQTQKDIEEQEAQLKVLQVTEFVTANDLASMMDVSVNDVISACMSLGMFVSINQRLDAETLSIVAEEFGFETEFVDTEEQESVEEEVDNPEDLVERYPIVTVMGHVDHGKTSLLDYVRKANVIAGEAGGITQHIGAYNVEIESGKRITFLDTPGHEAFTAMRARGAQVTDIAIIVIAADDNVMPQTKEAINHAQAAGVPIVFAFNKVDREAANPDKIREELSQMNILVEEWGGKYQAQEISAKTGQGVDDLLEKVMLEAEMLDVKANPNKNGVGTVIESELDKGRGYVSTLLVQAGTIRMGDVLLAGPHYGKVKAMFNERGQKITEAGPSMPFSLLGLSGAPNAGDKFRVMDDEREAKNIATKRLQLLREQGVRTKKHITLDEIGRRIAIGDFQELNVIIKGDVDGSIEALSDSLLKLSTDKIQVNVIHKSVGQISESDVMLAAASDAIIVGFQVRPSVNARKIAEREEIDIRLYSIIYAAIDEIKAAMEGMLAAKIEERVTATLEIRETFKISKVGTIAGCMVLDGKILRNHKVRIVRDGIVVYSGLLGSLKRFKDDVKEVARGYECGLNIENYNDIKEGDIIEAYEEVEVKQTL